MEKRIAATSSTTATEIPGGGVSLREANTIEKSTTERGRRREVISSSAGRRPTSVARRRALILAFSGVDGAGKSTQIELLQRHLGGASVPSVLCWARGGYTPLFSTLKRLLRRGAAGKLPEAGRSEERDRAMSKPWVRRIWLTASILDLALLYGAAVRWWRLRGRTVICDRYVADTLIDYAINFPDEHVETWWIWRARARIAPRPDVSFLMLLPVEESLRRCRAKNEPFSDSEERFRRRLDLYEEQGAAGDYRVLDARQSIEELFAEIRDEYGRLAAPGAARAD
jgi:dTMP kinase